MSSHPNARRQTLDRLGMSALAAALLLVVLMHHLGEGWGPFPPEWNLRLREPVDSFKTWVIANQTTHPIFLYFFDPISSLIDYSLRRLEAALLWLPWTVVMAGVFLLGWRAASWRVGVLGAACLFFMGAFGLWDESMQTLALMTVAVIISLLIGIPLGIVASFNQRFEAALRPVLDAMQTMPAFVYLIPVLLFFGVARVPSVVATVIYAIPPAIRLTNLGLRQVPEEVVEAARAFGSTPRQLLFKVKIPLAMPAIMAGVNQTIMMALGIVVIAALIGAGGLGREVLVSLQRLQVGKGLEAGLAIVFMAVLLDRISQAFTKPERARRRLTLLEGQGGELGPALEKVFQTAYDFGRRVSTGVAVGLTKLTLAVGGRRGKANGRQVEQFFARHAFFFTSLAFLIPLTGFFTLLNLSEFPDAWRLNLYQLVDKLVAWMRDHLYEIGDTGLGSGPFSDALTVYLLDSLRALFLVWLPWPAIVLGFALVALASGQARLAVFSAFGLVFIGLLGMWEHSMDTFSQVMVAVGLSVFLAIPLGVLAGRNDRFEMLIRPGLDFLQTIPPFVYLVPVIMLFNIGRVPGIIASVLYALPPGIRLINLGIREVDAGVIEAARAFGSTARQILFKVQFPLAMPAIMLGINQMVCMVLSMVIIAGLVGGGGLGLEAVIGLAKNETGRGVEAGLAIVIMAIILDRITQAWAERGKRHVQYS